MMPFRLAATVLLATWSGSRSQNLASDRPTYELQIHRTGPGSACSLVALHKTQTHKDLLVDNAEVVVSSSQRFYHGESTNGNSDTFEQHFSLDAHLLWDIATAECGSLSATTVHLGAEVPTDDFQVLHGESGQTVLAEPWHALPPAPELEVVPLIKSGPSANRIDFVFFGDGCKLHQTFLLSIFSMTARYYGREEQVLRGCTGLG